jgi:hypothetical protein
LVHTPNLVAVGQRLGVGDVEHGAQPAGAGLGDERAGVDDGAAGGVDEHRAVAHGGQLRRADQSVGGLAECSEHDDGVGLSEQAVELVDAVHAVPGA